MYFAAITALLCGCGNNSGTQQQASETNDTAVIAETQVDTTAQEIAEADTTSVRYLEALPAGYNEDEEFGLVLDYGGYAMDASVWPMGNGDWLVTSYWCMEEDEAGTITFIDENGNEVPKLYKDPFGGQPYPVVHKPELSFNTRNYGGQTINLFSTAEGNEVACSTNYKEISLRVLDADVKTRRLQVCSDPSDWCWGEPKDAMEAEYRHPFVELNGWIDEEWVCGNTVTTCP